MIVICGGGTGGHLAIARSFCDELNRRDIKPIFIGSTSGQDKFWFENDENFLEKFFLPSSGVVNKRGFAKLKSLTNIVNLALKCRKIFKTRKIGHSGTLDPEVDGVLPICVGKATKVVNYLMDSGKVYKGEITLGFATTTEDLEGEVISKVKLSEPFSDEKINEILSSFIGDIIQVPPIYSAIKVNGKKLYEYARAGEKVDIPERRVHIEYFKQIFPSKFDKEKGQQTIYFEVGCGKGTYVRTLASTIAFLS